VEADALEVEGGVDRVLELGMVGQALARLKTGQGKVIPIIVSGWCVYFATTPVRRREASRDGGS
jgi:hypothetical protein